MAPFLAACSASGVGVTRSCEYLLSREAGLNSNHGQFYFVVPRSVSATYSGIQEMWSETGQLVWRATFEKGAAAQFEDFSGDGSALVCNYLKKERLHEDCPSREEISNGIPIIQTASEPVVPPDRDLRGKCLRYTGENGW